MTRTASVFANAMVGALAIVIFTRVLSDQTHELSLAPEVQRVVMTEAVDLGDAQVPAAVSGENQAAVTQAYRQSFAITFGWIMWLSAGLSVLAALAAFFLIFNQEAVASDKE